MKKRGPNIPPLTPEQIERNERIWEELRGAERERRKRDADLPPLLRHPSIRKIGSERGNSALILAGRRRRKPEK